MLGICGIAGISGIDGAIEVICPSASCPMPLNPPMASLIEGGSGICDEANPPKDGNCGISLPIDSATPPSDGRLFVNPPNDGKFSLKPPSEGTFCANPPNEGN